MSYDYQTQKNVVFTEDGQVKFLKIRDRVHDLLATSGAFNLESAIQGVSGCTWNMMACVDRLVELGEIREITQGEVPGQDRVFVRNYRRTN